MHTTRKEYGVVGKHKVKLVLNIFDLLEMAWHQSHTYCDFNSTLMCSVMDKNAIGSVRK